MVVVAAADAAVVDGDVVAKAAASAPFLEDVVAVAVVAVELSSAGFSRQLPTPASPLAGVDERDRRRRPEVKKRQLFNTNADKLNKKVSMVCY